MSEDYRTSSEVAILTGLSEQRVRQAAKTLGVRKISTIYCWDEKDIEALRSRMGKRGRSNWTS